MKEAQKQVKKPNRSGFSGVDIALYVMAVLILFAAGFTGFYMSKAGQYRQAFFMNTYINGIDASDKTVEQVQDLINDGINGYRLEITTRDGKVEYLNGEDIGLRSEFDGTLEEMIENQKPYLWLFHCFKDSPYQIETMITYDQEQLDREISKLDCLDPNHAAAPQDARLSDYIEGKGYEIIPEQEGTLVDMETASAGICRAVMNLSNTISLEELNAYLPAAVTKEDETLLEELERRNSYVQMAITYRFGDTTEILDGDRLHQWLTFGEYGEIDLDEAAVGEYVAELAKNYNTAYQPKTLKTSYGDTVTITGGNYGWRINQSAETVAICEIIRSGQSQEREPIYSQTAASHGEHDYGSTYVEINLTAQHLFYYVDGSLLVEADFVSGNEARGWSTPAGAYPLTYKQRNATLRGEGYATPVSYWMPFNGGVGMHDASWRGSFGGTIYKTNGSHGCVNLPPAAAKTIYENISAGVPVLCYHLSGSGNRGNAAPPPTQPSPPPTQPLPPPTQPIPAETPPLETPPLETLPIETSPAETPPAETPPAGTAPGPGVPTDTAPSSEAPPAPQESSAPPETTGPGGNGIPTIAPPVEGVGAQEATPSPTPAPTAPPQPDGAETPDIIPAV